MFSNNYRSIALCTQKLLIVLNISWQYNMKRNHPVVHGGLDLKMKAIRERPTCACRFAAAPPVDVRTLDVLLSTFFCCSAMLYLQAALRYSLS